MFLKLIDSGRKSQLRVMNGKLWKCWILLLLLCIHKEGLRNFREHLSKLAFVWFELEQHFGKSQIHVLPHRKSIILFEIFRGFLSWDKKTPWP